jgi:hypothetical protein
MTAEDDLKELIRLAGAAFDASHNGADFTAAYAVHCAWHDGIKAKCEDQAYYQEYLAAAARLMPNYRRSP